MYHHIGSPAEDPWKLAVSAQRFYEHVEILRKHRTVMSLQELAQRREVGRLPTNAAAITFDDGYASNLHIAKPVLEKFGAPATVFVTTGFLQEASEPWWDLLASMLLGPTLIPHTVRMGVAGRTWEWHSPEWSKRQRKALHNDIHRILVPARAEEQQTALQMLLNQISSVPPPDPARRILTITELEALAAGGLIEIGAHTVNHPSLPSLGTEGQRVEIGNSKTDLEERLDRPVRGFAYPYGDHNSASVSAVLSLGFAYACTTAQGYVHSRDSRFRLPRFVVEDWDGEAFAKRFARRPQSAG